MENDLTLKAEDLNGELDSRTIIERISFTVKRGDIASIVNTNGAGKTFLQKMSPGIFALRRVK